MALACCGPLHPPCAKALVLCPPQQVYIDADLMKNEGDVLRDAERALVLARGRLLDSYSNVEAAADLVWDEVQVGIQLLVHWLPCSINDGVFPLQFPAQPLERSHLLGLWPQLSWLLRGSDRVCHPPAG